MNEPTHLDLFSGIGGFSIAAQACGFRTVAFCECEPYCQQILIEKFGAVLAHSEREPARARRSIRPEKGQETAMDCPVLHPDIFTLDGSLYRGVDLLTGGFPCQPFSCAGKRRGAADDRAIWPQMRRVIAEARPRWVLAENVPGIITMELDHCLSDLEALGYSTGTLVVPACAVDARHIRSRVWVLANANRTRRSSGWNDSGMGRQQKPAADARNNDAFRWLPEPDVGRVAHGIPARTHRLRTLGNAIVPQVAQEIIQAIAEQL